MPSLVITDEDLKNRFSLQAVGNQAEKYLLLSENTLALAILIAHTTPPSREQSLAITNLEQAIFWANAAIARNG